MTKGKTIEVTKKIQISLAGSIPNCQLLESQYFHIDLSVLIDTWVLLSFYNSNH